MSDEMILVPRDELLAWAEEWLYENDPGDDTDCVTPFDTYLLKSPAEAQAQGGGEVVAWKDSEGMLWSSMDEVPGQYLPPVRTFAPLYAHPPPSAPVGVAADILRIVDTAIDVCNDRDRPAMAEDLEAVRLYVEQASAALAKQPAAVDEAMVERAFNAWCDVADVDEWRVRNAPEALHAALTAALAGQHGGES